jgi:hypothetical protein
MTNTNPETGIRYGCIYLNSLDPDVAEELWTGGKNISELQAYKDIEAEIERDADNIEDEVRTAIAECDPSLVGNEDWFERRCEDAWNAAGYDSREDYIDSRIDAEMQDFTCEEPTISGTYEGVKYEISWLGGAPLLWALESPTISKARLCSPCCPGAIDLNSLDDDYEGYGIPDDWRAEE